MSEEKNNEDFIDVLEDADNLPCLFKNASLKYLKIGCIVITVFLRL